MGHKSNTRSQSMKEWHRKRTEALSFLDNNTAHLEKNPIAVKSPTQEIVIPYVNRRVNYSRYKSIDPEQADAILESVDTGRMDEIQDLFDVICHDPAVLNATGLRKSALVSTPFQIEPASNEPQDIQAAQLIRDIIADIDEWEDFLDSALSAVFRGISVHKMELMMEGNIWKVKRLQWIHPRSFVFDENFNLHLWDNGAYGPDGLHLNPGLWVIHNPKTFDAYPHRQGLLRACAMYVIFKKLGINYWLGGAEKFGFPMLIGKITNKAMKEARENLLTALENVSSYTAAVEDEGVDIRALDFAAPPVVIWDSLTAMFNKEISQVILGARLVVDTSTDGGSWALGKEHKGAFLTKVRSDSIQLSNTLRKQLFRPLLDRNKHLFDKAPRIPKISWMFEDRQPEVQPWHLDKGVINADEARKHLGYEPRAMVRPASNENNAPNGENGE